MPKSVQPKVKGHLHDIWQAETKAEADAAFDFFIETYGVKYDKATAKLLSFYDFPAEHWKHIRTSNPPSRRMPAFACLGAIESTFATVRHRTGKTRGCLSRKTGLAMASKPMMSAQAKWRRLDGANRLPEIVQEIAFKDGIKQVQDAALCGCRPLRKKFFDRSGVIESGLVSGLLLRRFQKPLAGMVIRGTSPNLINALSCSRRRFWLPRSRSIRSLRPFRSSPSHTPLPKSGFVVLHMGHAAATNIGSR